MQIELEKLECLLSEIGNLLRSQHQMQKNIEASIPKFLTREYATINSDVALTLYPQSHNLEKISSILVYASSGPATLTLGRRVIPLAAGITPITNLEMFLLADDIRQLRQPVAGPMFLELMGIEVATTGSGGIF
jgi:hypothetical protein